MLMRAAIPRAHGSRRVIAAVAATVVIAAVGARTASAQAKEDTLPRTHVVPALGVRFGTPQKASAALGVVVGEDWQKNGRDHSRNLALFAEPGVSGGRGSLAYVSHGYGTFGSGFGVAATVLRTWNDPWTVRQNQSYMGGEIILWPVVFIGPRIGLFRNISTNETSRRWFLSFDFGIGL